MHYLQVFLCVYSADCDVYLVQVSRLYTSDLIQWRRLLMGNLICASCRACPEIKVNVHIHTHTHIHTHITLIPCGFAINVSADVRRSNC